jgi:hypothetical protein
MLMLGLMLGQPAGQSIFPDKFTLLHGQLVKDWTIATRTSKKQNLSG